MMIATISSLDANQLATDVLVLRWPARSIRMNNGVQLMARGSFASGLTISAINISNAKTLN